MNLSENIKKIRERNRISQSELAKRLGVEPTNYPRIEKRGNNLTYDYIELFAKSLEVSVAELLDLTPPNSIDKSEDIETLIFDNKKLIERIAELEDDKRRLKKQLDELEARFVNLGGSTIFTFIFHEVVRILETINKRNEAIKQNDIEKINKYTDYLSSQFYGAINEVRVIEQGYMEDDWNVNNTKFSEFVKDDLMLKAFVGESNMSLFRKEYFDALMRYEENQKNNKT